MDANVRDMLLLVRKSFEKIRDAASVTAELLEETDIDDNHAQRARDGQLEILNIAKREIDALKDVT